MFGGVLIFLFTASRPALGCIQLLYPVITSI
jgi:hypothetical protein